VTSSLRDQLQSALGDAYQLEHELGGGGMSHVFVADEKALGRKVVVKVLLPDLAAGVNVDRFRREIQLAAQLQHPHIVPLLAAGEADGLPFFIMPFVTGESLRARVQREGELPIAETIRILRDVVSALAYAHARGVVHRDVKPDNVLISGGVAVVTDFGVAKAVSASSEGKSPSGAAHFTSLGVALGTPAYMAPEQATASPHTDHRADIYALGVMTYEMLTGLPPFTGSSAQVVLAAQVVEEPVPVERRRPAVPPMLAALVRDCLAKRPADRPQSATDVLHALDAIVTPSGGTAPTTAVRMPLHPTVESAPVRRSPWPLLAAVGVVVLIVAVALMVRRPPSSPPSSPTPMPATGTASQPGPAPPADSTAIQPVAPMAPEPAPDSAEVPRAAPPSRARKQPPQRVPPRRAETRRQPDTAVARPDTTDRGLDTAAIAAPPPPSPPQARPPVSADTVAAKPAAPVSPPAVAPPQPAAPAADPRPEIRALIAEYAAAVEAGSLTDLQRVYPGMTSLQQRGWEQFFQLVRDVTANLVVGQLDLAPTSAEAHVTGTYTYLNTSTQRTESQPVAFRATLRREGGRWRIAQVR
jgi:serine/threonine-protein kinase